MNITNMFYIYLQNICKNYTLVVKVGNIRLDFILFYFYFIFFSFSIYFIFGFYFIFFILNLGKGYDVTIMHDKDVTSITQLQRRL